MELADGGAELRLHWMQRLDAFASEAIQDTELPLAKAFIRQPKIDVGRQPAAGPDGLPGLDRAKVG